MEHSPVLIKTDAKTTEIYCEVASSPQEISAGLMGKYILSQDTGMLFLFNKPTRSNFWMLNTLIPLSIAFFDETGKILDIQDMHPQTIEGHAPDSPFMGALEMNQGWFTRNEVSVGDYITKPKESHPLMLNEEIYYGNDYGTVTHKGIELDNDENPVVLPWDKAHEDLIVKIHPRIITGKTNTTKTAAKPLRPKAPDDLPGIGAFLDKYGPSTFQRIENDARDFIGIGYKEGVDNLTALFRDSYAWMTPSERERTRDWYDTEFKPVVDFGERLGLQRSTTAGAVARLSVQAPWFPTSVNFPHRGNREENLKLIHVMHRLATSNYHVPETIQRDDITIPAGHHTLDTLSDQQIAALPELGDSAATFPEHREKAVELLRRDYMGSPITLEQQIVMRNRGTGSAYKQAPKIVSFEKPILLGLDAPYTTIDRHHVNAIVNRSMPGSDYKAFRKRASKLMGREALSSPVGYDWLAALTEDARHISNLEHGENFLRNPHQAFLWSAQIARFKGEDDLTNVVKGFIRSPNSGLYKPYHHEPDEDCASLHDFIKSK